MLRRFYGESGFKKYSVKKYSVKKYSTKIWFKMSQQKTYLFDSLMQTFVLLKNFAGKALLRWLLYLPRTMSQSYAVESNGFDFNCIDLLRQ
jgi:hypothetical protein